MIYDGLADEYVHELDVTGPAVIAKLDQTRTQPLTRRGGPPPPGSPAPISRPPVQCRSVSDRPWPASVFTPNGRCQLRRAPSPDRFGRGTGLSHTAQNSGSATVRCSYGSRE